ncbi:hypothetical protein LTR16_004041, partial [Cryomyces antarcticus]
VDELVDFTAGAAKAVRLVKVVEDEVEAAVLTLGVEVVLALVGDTAAGMTALVVVVVVVIVVVVATGASKAEELDAEGDVVLELELELELGNATDLASEVKKLVGAAAAVEGALVVEGRSVGVVVEVVEISDVVVVL